MPSIVKCAIAALCLASVGLLWPQRANAAPVVAYTLSLQDNGFGTPTPGMFAIYAEASPDNGGLFAFSVDLVDGSVTSITNMAQSAIYRHTPASPSFPNKFAGFGAGITEDAAAGRISGVADLAKASNLIPVYGFAQIDGDMRSSAPAGYDVYIDSNPNEPGPIYHSKFLLGVGTYAGPPPAWQAGSIDNRAHVYDDCSGTQSIQAQLILLTFPGGPLSQQAAYSSAAAVPCAAVPEPSTMTLLSLAALSVMARRHRNGSKDSA